MDATAEQSQQPRIKPGPPTKREAELIARLERVESRQAAIVEVLAGTCQAGGWLQRQIEMGHA